MFIVLIIQNSSIREIHFTTDNEINESIIEIIDSNSISIGKYRFLKASLTDLERIIQNKYANYEFIGLEKKNAILEVEILESKDIIDNNVTFQLPTGAVKSELHMRRITGEAFSKARRNGKFQEIDFLESFFTGHEIELNMFKKGGLKRSKTVYVDPRLKQRIIDNTNKGKQYC